MLFLEGLDPEQRNDINRELTLYSVRMTSAFSLYVVSEICGMSSQLRNMLGLDPAATALPERSEDAVIIDLSWHEGPSYFHSARHKVPRQASQIGEFVDLMANLFAVEEEMEPKPLSAAGHLIRSRALTCAQAHFQPWPTSL